jgi:Zn-dependent peptidase ImmA (M78 family)/transcriptional regulator with XRE-family HTH domain
VRVYRNLANAALTPSGPTRNTHPLNPGQMLLREPTWRHAGVTSDPISKNPRSFCAPAPKGSVMDLHPLPSHSANALQDRAVPSIVMAAVRLVVTCLDEACAWVADDCSPAH